MNKRGMMKMMKNILPLVLLFLSTVTSFSQVRDNYVMMADLTGYPRTYDAAAELQMDTIKQLLTAIDPTTADFKVFETGVYRLNEYFEDAEGIEAKIKATFDAAYPDQRNYVLFYKLVNSKDEFASIKVITNLNINNSCFDKVKFERDLNFFYQYSGINPKDLGPVIVSALEYVKFKIRRLECCANVTSRVGTKREVNSVCSVVDIVEVEDVRLANLYFYSNLKCKVGVTTLVASNLPNYQDELDPSTYKFVFGSKVNVAKIGTFYYSFYKFPPGVGPPDANDPKYIDGYQIPNLTEDYTVETKPAIGTGVSGLPTGITIQAKFYTFIVKLGTEFYVVKTTSTNLVLQGLDQPKDYEKLFTGIVDDPSLFTSGYLCDIPERLERTCNPKEFVNYLKNVLKYSAYNFQYFRQEDLLNKAYTSFNKCAEIGFESLARYFHQNPCDLKELVEGTSGSNQQFVEAFYKNIFQKYPFGLNSTTELDIRITGGNIWPSFTEQYKIECKDCKVEISPLIGLSSNPAFVGAPPTREYGSPQSYTYADPIIIPTATINQLGTISVGTISNISKKIIPAGLLCKAQDDQFWQKFSTTVDVASIAFGGYHLYLARAVKAMNTTRRFYQLEGALGIISGSGNLFIKSGYCPTPGFCEELSSLLTMISYLELSLGVKDLVTAAYRKQLAAEIRKMRARSELNTIEGGTEVKQVLDESIKTLDAIEIKAVDDQLNEFAKFADNEDDVANTGLANWKTFQKSVDKELVILYPNNKIGSQITLDVYYTKPDGTTGRLTIIPDNLILFDYNGIKRYKVIDAKTSIRKDLSKEPDLTYLCTDNQKIIYRILDGDATAGTITKVEMRGGQAEQAFGPQEFINGKATITLEPAVEFWVNSSAEDFTKYVRRTRILIP
jgi:hypothetical protein